MKTKLLFILGLAATELRADPVTLSRTEATELHAALTSISAGLSPENTFAAADDINALEGTAKGFKQSYGKLFQLQQTATTPELVAKFRDEDAKFAAAADEKKVYDLKPFTLSKEEVKAANVNATTLAAILRLLKVDKK